MALNSSNRSSNFILTQTRHLRTAVRIIPDSLWLSSSVVIASGLNYIVQAIPSWFLPEPMFAQYAIVLTVLLLVASTLGTGISYEVAVATARDEPQIDSSSVILVTIIPLSVIATIVLYASYSFGAVLAMLTGAALVLQVVLMLFKGVFLGKERIKSYGSFHMLEPATKALFVMLAVIFAPTATSAMAGYLLAVFLVLLLIAWRSQGYRGLIPHVRLHDFVKSLGPVVTSFMMILAYLVILSYGTLYLGKFDRVNTAYLAALLLMVRFPWYVLSSVSIASLPKVAKTPSPAERATMYYAGLYRLLKTSLPVYLVTAVLGLVLVKVLFPPNYGQVLAWPLFAVAALAHELLVLAFYKSMMLLAVRNNRHLWAITLTGIASMILSTWALGSYGIWGVVLGILVASMATMLVSRVDQPC